MAKALAQAPARKGPQTAIRIREAALELFSRLGFERATMAEIAAGKWRGSTALRSIACGSAPC